MLRSGVWVKLLEIAALLAVWSAQFGLTLSAKDFTNTKRTVDSESRNEAPGPFFREPQTTTAECLYVAGNGMENAGTCTEHKSVVSPHLT